MPLDANEEQKVQQWFRTTFPAGLICPYCRGGRWNTHAIVAPPLLENGVAILDEGIPQLVLICERCYHTATFSAKLIGLVS